MTAGTIVPSSPATPATDSSSATRLYVPTALPSGWFVHGATPPVETESGGGFAYFGDRSDLDRGRAVAVGYIGGDDGFDGLRDAHPDAVGAEGPPGTTLSRNGDFVWVTWPTATRRTRPIWSRPRPERRRGARRAWQVPGDIGELGRADVGPDYAAPAQRIELVDRSGKQRIEIEVSSGAADGARLQQVLGCSSRGLRTHENQGGHHAVHGAPGRAIVVHRG